MGTVLPTELDLRVLAELKAWSKHAEAWVRHEVLLELIDAKASDVRDSLGRLRERGAVEHEYRVGYRLGFWRFVKSI